MQGLQKVRRLGKNEVEMHIENEMRIAAHSIGMMTLRLPSGFLLELNNCYFVPALCKNIISGSCLLQDSYSFNSVNNVCSISMRNMFYGFAPIVGGLFTLDLRLCLGHIGKKRMQKLHSDGILPSFDLDSFDK